MQPSFKPPKNEAELKQRAEKLTIEAARNLKKIIEQRKANAAKEFDVEIAFYDAVIKIKEGK